LYDTSEIDLFRFVLDAEARPIALEPVATLAFRLPEIEKPIAVWHDAKLWFQRNDGLLACVNTRGEQVSAESLSEASGDELSALVFTEGSRLATIREGNDSLLLSPGVASSRLVGVDVISACAIGAESVAVALSDGTVRSYDLSAELVPFATVRVRGVRGEMGWDGRHVLLLTELHAVAAWQPNAGSLETIANSDELFPQGLHQSPLCWLACVDGSLLLLTTHGVIRLRLSEGHVRNGERIDDLFGGAAWSAVRRLSRRSTDWWLVEREPLRERLLGKGIRGRLHSARDGRGRFFGVGGDGRGFVFEVENELCVPLRQCPLGVNMVAGDAQGGCWLVDRIRDIYYADESGNCGLAMRIELPGVTGARIQSCGDHVVWSGYSSKVFAETGSESARTLAFFKVVRTPELRVTRVGHHVLHPREGICEAICYDAGGDQLVTVWTLEGKQGYRLRSGTVEEFSSWQIRQQDIVGVGDMRFLQAALSPDSRWLGVLGAAGDLVCLNVDDGRAVATLSPSLPFTAIATGGGATTFWVVEAGSQVYGCQFKVTS
jgi:hypothetical protein